MCGTVRITKSACGKSEFELVGPVQFGNPRRGFAAALVDADDTHPERGGEPGDLAADATDPDDQHGRLGEVNHALVLRRLFPFAAQLLRDVALQPTGEGQHERHHMRGDMVVVDFAEIGDLDGVGDQLRIIIAGGRCRLRRLQPFEPPRLAQQRRRDRAKSGFGAGDRPLGAGHVLGDEHVELGHRGGEPRAPFARLIILRRQHQKFGRHGASLR